MIDIQYIRKIRDLPISFNEYFTLILIKHGEPSNTDNTSLLIEGYLSVNEQLTPKSLKLIELIEGKEVKKVVYDYKGLHERLQNKLFELIGKKQKVINGKFSFLPNAKDLESRLFKVIVKYDLQDWKRIEDLLSLHVVKSHKSDWKYIVLMDYYIFKDNRSLLATDYLGSDENIEVKQKAFPKDIKDLF